MNYAVHVFRQVKKWPNWIFRIPVFIMCLIYRCCFRHRIEDRGHVLENRVTGQIGLLWHNRLLFFAPSFPGWMRRTCAAVISASRDGQYVADIVACFGIEALRGSSSRGGLAAQRGAIAAVGRGKNVIFTPDGPRGPRYHIKPGPVRLASKTGAKIYPISVNASRYWQFHSWDGFQIPKPFSTLTLVIGEPISVPPDLDAAAEAEFCRIVDEAMMKITCDKDSRLK